jgi:putative ABC transport system permease protein
MHAGIGDGLTLIDAGRTAALTVCGIQKRVELGALQRPLVLLPRDTLAAAVEQPGELTSISVILRPGADIRAFCADHAAEMPRQVVLEPAEMVRTGFDRRVRASRLALMIGSMLTFLSAAFIIVTGLTAGVTERQRELAVIRSIGASRPQVFLSQLAAGMAVGAAGLVAGAPLGVGLTALLLACFRDVLPAGLHLSPFGLLLALGGAILAGGAGSAYPAWLASRVPPTQAMSYGARPPRVRGFVACCLAAAMLIALHLVLIRADDPESRFRSWVSLGLPSVFIAYFLLAVPVVTLLACLLGPLLAAACGLPRGLLSRSILATPFRHGLTAGALMVGTAILVAVWTDANSLMRGWLDRIRFPDGFALRHAGLRPQQRLAIESLPFVTATTPIGRLPLEVRDRRVFGIRDLTPSVVQCFGFDAGAFFHMNTIDWVQGDPAEAIPALQRGEGIIVADRFLTARGIGLGDRLTLGRGRTSHDFCIVGVVSSGGLELATQLFGIYDAYMEYSLGSVFMDIESLRRVFDNHDIHILQVNLAPDIPDEEAERRIAEAAPGVVFRSGRWIKTAIDDIAATLLTVESVIAFAALVLASLGVGNIIIANIAARRFEYGVMRAIGSSRWLLVRLILAEALLLALTGGLVGTALGIHLSWVGTIHNRGLLGLDVAVRVPPVPVAAGWAVLVSLVLLAAVPAALSVIRPPPCSLLAPGRNG